MITVTVSFFQVTMKALYCQQNSSGEEMTFIFQERVSSDHNSTINHSVEEGSETSKKRRTGVILVQAGR